MSNFGFSHDHGENAQFVQAKDKVMDSLKNFFRPEFLNRLDETIIFDILSPEVISDIVKIQVADVVKRLEKKEIILSVSEDAMKYIAKEGYDPKFGARPLKRVIQSKILTPIANMMVGEGMMQGGTVNVGLDKEGKLSFDIKKKARATKKVVVEKEEKKPAKKKAPVVA